MPDDRTPERGPSNEAPAEPHQAIAPDQLAPTLVWPPTSEELDAWEVVPLRDPSEASKPPTIVPQPAEPAIRAPAAAGPTAQGAVVVRIAPSWLTRPREGRDGPSASKGAGESQAATRRRSGRLAAPRSAMAILIVVPLLAVLSAAAGFAAALWIGPRLFVDTSRQTRPTVVIVESREPGSQVLVNGEPWGTTPLRLSMAGGETRIAIEPRPVPPTSSSTTPGAVRPTAGVLRGSPRGKASGSVLIRSTPPGARVVLRGRFRGLTPLTIGGIPPGLHEVEVAGQSGSALRRLDVRAGQLARLDVDLQGSPRQVPSGFLSVRSRIPLEVRQGRRLLGTSSATRITLPAGVHDLQLVAEAFEFTTSQRVEVRADRTVTLAVDLPNGRVSFNAEPWAEVWLEGRRLGETPLLNIVLPLGTHDVVFRHPQLGERRETVTVRARTPARVGVRLTP